MRIKTLVIIGAMLTATSAFAQNQSNQGTVRDANDHQQQPQTPGSSTNAQGEKQAPGRTMQEKGTSITNDEKGAKGTPGSTGTQSGTNPNGSTK